MWKMAEIPNSSHYLLHMNPNSELHPSADSPPQPQPTIISNTNRRPRGRPKGAKNKTKPPVTIIGDGKDSSNAPMRTHILQVSSGNDVVESISEYLRRRGRGVSILSASGAVANVTVRKPGGGVVTLQGCSLILSLTGTLLPPPCSIDLSIFLSGGNGQVLGGSVVGPLVAAGLLVLTAVSFEGAEYERLPLEEEDGSADAAAAQSSVVSAGGIANSGGGGVLNSASGNADNYPFAANLFGLGGVRPPPPPPTTFRFS